MQTFEYTNHEHFNNSSALRQAWYNSQTKELVVEFHTGTLAGYKDFAETSYDHFINSFSVGQYYAYNIRNNFSGFSIEKWTDFVYVSPPSENVIEKTANKEFKIVATVSSEVTTTVSAADLTSALAEFQKIIDAAMSGNTVGIDFKSVTAV